MNAGAYLDRIGYAGPLDPSPATLAGLQEAHLLAVPFENLDIRRGVPIVLDPAAIEAKVVGRRRGGFCYELNGLFHGLLSALGFSVSMISARVYDAERGAFGPEFDHLAIVAEFPDGPRLADVGFGDFSLRPLRIIDDEIQRDPAGEFRISRSGGGRRTVFRRTPGSGAFEPQYDFTAEPRRLPDFGAMCLHHQTSPDSHFTRKSVCSMATPGGRVTLASDRLIETSGNRRTEIPLPDEAAREAALREKFGITL